MEKNPYTLSFGKKPLEYIVRPAQTDEIIGTFKMDKPATQVYLVSGVRGSGKTVTLTGVSSYFSSEKDWIVLNLSPDIDILGSAADKLSNRNFLKKYLSDIDVTLKGVGVGISVKNDESDADTQLRNILPKLKKRNKKVLFIIDEVARNEYVKAFASCFQIYLREEYPVYLLMAGLFENISDLQNDRTLTFLYRAPRIPLEPLSLPAMSINYEKTLRIPREKAIEMARLTKGYAYAFQTLGYLMWGRQDKEISEILPEFDNYLSSYVYDKIWSELSIKDREVMAIIAGGKNEVSEIRTALDISPQLMNVYRKRLVNKGLIDARIRGKMTMALPRFENYVQIYGAIEM